MRCIRIYIQKRRVTPTLVRMGSMSSRVSAGAPPSEPDACVENGTYRTSAFSIHDLLSSYRTPNCPVGAQLSRMLKSLNAPSRSEEHTSELQSLMRISYAVFRLKNKTLPHVSAALRHRNTLTHP